ncbi:MAG: hypothetical protein ACJ76P_04520 [Actinomycetota bacterium]
MRRTTRRIAQIALAVPIAIALMAGTALAADQTSGVATTNAGNTIRFDTGCNVALVSDRCPVGEATGTIDFLVNPPNTYTDPANGNLESFFCDGIDSYRFELTAHGYPRTRITATCDGTFLFGEGSVPVYVKCYFVDKGVVSRTDPSRDRINCYASTHRAYRHNAELDPDRLLKDIGLIQDGDVQIAHT